MFLFLLFFFDKIALFVEILNALNNRGISSDFHVRIETIQYMNLSFKEHYSIEMSKCVSCDNYWFVFIAFSQHFFKLFFEVIGVWSKTAEEKCVSFELLLLHFSSEGFFILKLVH